MRRSWWLWLALLLPLGGCTLGSYFWPREAPMDAGLSFGRQPGHYVAHGGPQLVEMTEWLGLYRHTSWTSPAGTFDSYVFCPLGLPQPGEHARCLDTYAGIKCDWTETLVLQQTKPGWFDYVFTDTEQWAFRFTTVSYPIVSNMAGS